MRVAARRLAVGAVFVLVATFVAVPASAQSGARELGVGSAMYPRLIRLQHSGWWYDGRILASLVAFSGGTHAEILESTDDGTSFHRVGQVTDPAASSGACCGTLYELPARLGALPAGTVLWAGSFGMGNGRDGEGAGARSIRVWASRDHGRSWRYLSECATNPPGVGLWEPELTMTAGGRLACFFGDESFRGHSQVIAMTLSSDGLHWSGPDAVVATPPGNERPGMPVIRRLPDGRYFLSYENCNVPGHHCGGYWRMSSDGVHWGDPAGYGHRIATPDGHYFQHAQTIALVPGGPHGTRIVSVGQLYVDAASRPAPGNGSTVLVNDDFGSGPWYPAPAPVAVAHPRNAPCPNYSSALLATGGGDRLLEIATHTPSGTADAGNCRAYVASGPLATG